MGSSPPPPTIFPNSNPSPSRGFAEIVERHYKSARMETIALPSIPEGTGSILGLGIDLVASERVRRMLSTHGDRFLKRCFTAAESEYCMGRKDPIPDLAVRLAAKEAGFKAIGGRRGMGLKWRDFEVVMARDGVPGLALRGTAAERGKLINAGKVWLSLTHEDEWSAAVVVITRDNSASEK